MLRVRACVRAYVRACVRGGHSGRRWGAPATGPEAPRGKRVCAGPLARVAPGSSAVLQGADGRGACPGAGRFVSLGLRCSVCRMGGCRCSLPAAPLSTRREESRRVLLLGAQWALAVPAITPPPAGCASGVSRGKAGGPGSAWRTRWGPHVRVLVSRWEVPGRGGLR